jgi:hypothetical protein
LILLIAFSVIERSLFAAETILVPENAPKAVLVPKSAVSENWKDTKGFDDSSWRLCMGRPGGVGYEKNSGYENLITLDVGDDMHDDGGDPNESCLIRIKFNVSSSDLTAFQVMTLSMRFDDGFAAFLNGTMIASTNVPDPLEWNSGAPESIESEGQVHFNVSGHLNKLVAGENMLAIHGVNNGTSSSDFLINAKLSANTQSPQGFTSSNLPIIIINTNGQNIRDEVRIQADMGIIHNDNGQRNNVTDPYNHYDGKIGIEYRGSTSQSFPKKPFRIETTDAEGENNNVSLFGMPSENDWVLHNPYSDKSLIRNVLAYKISNDIGRYASKTQLCELVLNGEYQGVYVFMEKIKRDKNRVDIARLDLDDVAGDSLTGGYIIKVDKHDGEQVDGWNGDNVFYQYHYPAPDDILPEQKTYIRNFMIRFEHVMGTSNFDSPTIGYAKYIDMETLVDHFIINEVTRNIDAYRLSAYMYKDRDDNDPLLKFGPVWDFNLSFGNADYFDGWKADGWNLDHLIVKTAHEFTPPFWWGIIRDTDDFKGRVYRRWMELRQGALRTDGLVNYISSLADTLHEAQIRNFNKWPVLGEDVWPNWFVANTYEEEIEFMQDWLTNRLNWMDDAIDEYKAMAVDFDEPMSRPADYVLSQNYPNPFNPSTTIQFSTPVAGHITLVMYSSTGQEIDRLVDGFKPAGDHQVTWFADGFPSGVYLYQLKAGDIVQTKKLIKLK